ncbi:MAG TPA: hypothetical protein PLH57_06280, partial [Oligoflexia bacterium]|nr:hypothetical protein [Oligoflexia bacterium]
MGIEQTSSERSQLSQLLNTKTLLGRVVTDDPELGNSNPMVFALSKGGISTSATQSAPTSALRLDPQLSVSLEQHPLNAAFEILTKDVRASRDRLLALNPGRRTAIERRLEFIARKVARARGEKLNRSLSLTDILRESYRETDFGRTLGLAAWEGFVAEVALFQILGIFFLKHLGVLGWRSFENADLGRLNFTIHSFLQNCAQGFSYDKHCWNFVRSNLYSWYVPSTAAQQQLAAALEQFNNKSENFEWSDHSARKWMSTTPLRRQFRHLDFDGERKVAAFCEEVLEKLGVTYLSSFHGETVCKKTFLPCLELGDFSLNLVEKLLTKLGGECTDICTDSSQVSRAIWACESELFEVSFTEMMGLLALLRHLKECSPTRTRLPQILHIAPLMGLELHNLEQLPLGGPDVSRLHQGTAGQIQQIEGFDQALVLDHIDRSKSTRWLKALSEQLPHWRGLLSSSSNLNWGELHLNLAISKLKENGTCVYLSHRVLPDSHDGERLRKALLGMATLEYFVELTGEELAPYRYLYVFRRVHNKNERDLHRPRFGKFGTNRIDFTELEDSSATQHEL